ncbi:MAG: hypothetical protein K6A77_10765 [Clostridiales bacterium]|nr:hypothetical protein [Clostridiales bacterium]
MSTLDQQYWLRCRDELKKTLAAQGFPPELGEVMASRLGSPKAIQRMTSYLRQAQPRTVEMIVDEMLSICAEIEAWKQKKEAREANAKYNEMLYYGLTHWED